MGTASSQPTFRIPILLFAVANLSVLGLRLWPWADSMRSLPGDGTALIDPAMSLLGYIALSFWIGSVKTDFAKKQLYVSGGMGVLGGVLLAAQVFMAVRPGSESRGFAVQYALMAAAVALWGLVAMRAIRAGHSKAFAVICSVWSALVSCGMACLTLLAGSFYAMAPGQTADPWKQYQGLALGSEDTQALVHTLLTATGFLLVGPIVACIAGAIFASFATPAAAKKA